MIQWSGIKEGKESTKLGSVQLVQPKLITVSIIGNIFAAALFDLISFYFKSCCPPKISVKFAVICVVKRVEIYHFYEFKKLSSDREDLGGGEIAVVSLVYYSRAHLQRVWAWESLHLSSRCFDPSLSGLPWPTLVLFWPWRKRIFED